jgi:hypothetical protein
MSSNRILTVGLPALALFTAGVVLFQKFGPSEKQNTPRPLSENLPLNEIERISIEKEAQKVLLVRNGNGGWNIENDNSFVADAGKISRLLDTVTSAKIERTVTKRAENPDEFGLGSRAAKISFEAKGKSVLSMVLGESRSGGGQYFKFAEPDAVYLLSSGIRPELEFDGWAFKTLVKISKKDVRSVQWEDGRNLSAKVVYSRAKEADKFELSPAKAAVSEEKFTKLLDRLENLSFEKRKPRSDKSATDSLNSPERKITLKLFDGRLVTLLSGIPLADSGGLVPMDITFAADESSGKALSAAQLEEKAKFGDYAKKFFFLYPADVAQAESSSLSKKQNEFKEPKKLKK